jgi:hypothetical protein
MYIILRKYGKIIWLKEPTKEGKPKVDLTNLRNDLEPDK